MCPVQGQVLLAIHTIGKMVPGQVLQAQLHMPQAQLLKVTRRQNKSLTLFSLWGLCTLQKISGSIASCRWGMPGFAGIYQLFIIL